MLLEGGIADAYGAGFEFADEKIISLHNKLESYRVHPKYDCIYKTYSDDTQMAIAISELILENKDWSKLNIANKFVEVFKRDPRKGYSSRFYNILNKVNSGEELIKVIVPKSNRNGAAMRSYPIGIYKDLQEVKIKSAQQAVITHNTSEGILSAQLMALTSHFLIYKKGDKNELKDFLEDELSQKFNFDYQSTKKMEALPTVNTVIKLILENTKMSNCLKAAVDTGNDTDTVASLAVALLSICSDTKQDLPNWLYLELENETYGRDYLDTLDKKLKEFVVK